MYINMNGMATAILHPIAARHRPPPVGSAAPHTAQMRPLSDLLPAFIIPVQRFGSQD
jgi:hypothetical protein